MYSGTNDPTSTYSISDLQLKCDYVASPSLTSYFNSTGVNYHSQNWTHRYQAVDQNRNVLRVPSAYSSLSKILVLIRDQSIVDSTTNLATRDRQQRVLAYSSLSEIQMYSNNIPFFSEPLTGERLSVELWNELLKAVEFKRVDVDTNVTGQIGGCPAFAFDLTSCPTRFQSEVVSGLKTKSHVSDLYHMLVYKTGVVTANLAATVFLANDVRLYTDSANCLQIEY